MSPFDFSILEEKAKRQPKPRFRDLALTAEQVEVVLSSKHGVTDLLLQEFENSTRCGDRVQSFIKALWVFEEYGRDTSYGAIAAAMEVSSDTAREYMREARSAIQTALGIQMVSSGDSIRLMSTGDARDRAERVLNVFKQHVEPALKKLEACTTSLSASNMPLALGPRMKAILAASKVDAEEVG